MEHQHVHSHNHTLTSLNSIFIVCIIINLLFVIIEAGAGFLFNSLGLLSDAGHNLSDVFSLLLCRNIIAPTISLMDIKKVRYWFLCSMPLSY